MSMLDILGRGSRGGGGISPITLALLGTLAYRTLKGKGRLADMLGTAPSSSAGATTPSVAPGATQASAQGGLGGLLGGLSGAGLGAGLRDLLARFRETGQEAKAQSWVSTGANHDINPSELEQVLGNERIQWLMEQTGLPKEQLLAGLSSELPSAVDKLTPGGQVPSDEELAQQLKH
ncbi:MAG: YidB family protein [Gammaproteobacteria bacterium]